MPLKPKSYSVEEVLNNAKIGVIFEFYCSKDTTFIVEDLAKLSAKNVVVTNDEKYIPSFYNSILIKEYEAEKPRYQFRLDQQQYYSMLPIIHEVSNWLKENAQTTYDTLMKVQLSFNHHALQTLETISGMNPSKLIMKFNESYIYDRFPKQKNSPYAFSIKAISPLNATYLNENDLNQNINNILLLPKKSFYGINFENHMFGVLEFNYIGGKNYPDKIKDINEVIEYYIVKTYQSLNEEDYYKNELDEFKKMTVDLHIIQECYYDYNLFERHFKDIRIYSDLKTSPQLIKSLWTQLRDPLFEAIIKAGFRKGQFNYDSTVGRYQIKSAELTNANLRDFDFIKCTVNGLFENCYFHSTKIAKSRLINCKLVSTCDVSESFLNKVSANLTNLISDTFIINSDEVLNCEIKDSVIKFASIGSGAKLSESCIVIEKPEHLPKQVQGITDVDQIRDYRWIKSLTMRHDKGMQNLYDRKKYMK